MPIARYLLSGEKAMPNCSSLECFSNFCLPEVRSHTLTVPSIKAAASAFSSGSKTTDQTALPNPSNVRTCCCQERSHRATELSGVSTATYLSSGENVAMSNVLPPGMLNESDSFCDFRSYSLIKY